MTPEALTACFVELEKLSALSSLLHSKPSPPPKSPQVPSQEKEQGVGSKVVGSVKKNVGAGTLAAGGAAALLTLKNPAAAAKYLKHGKELVTKPGKSIARGWRSGRTDITSGAGASDAASKRVGMYKDTFRDAGDGSLLQHDVLTKADPGFLRRQNLMSVGERRAHGLKLDKDLQARVDATRKSLDAGNRIPEKQLRALYDEIGQAGKAQKLTPGAGLGTYGPGERTLNVGLGTAGGAYEGLQSEDEDGRKRGIGERLARGAMGAGTGVAMGHMFLGRGTGLSSKNLLPEGVRKALPQKVFGNRVPLTGERSILSQKGLLPAATGGVLAAGGAVAADAAGGGGKMIDRAFGQDE